MQFDWTAIGAWASFLATVIVGAFVYGRTTEKVETHSNKFLEVDTRLNSHSADLRRHDNDLTRIKTHLNLD